MSVITEDNVKAEFSENYFEIMQIENQSMPESSAHFQDIYRRSFTKVLYSIDVTYAYTAGKFELQFTNVKQKAGDIAKVKSFKLRRLANCVYGVTDYITLQDGQTLTVNCRVDVIRLVKDANFVNVYTTKELKSLYKTPTKNLRDQYERDLLTTEGRNYLFSDTVQLNA